MWRPPGAFDAQLGLLGYHLEGGADEVGELGALQPRPQALDRVELSRPRAPVSVGMSGSWCWQARSTWTIS